MMLVMESLDVFVAIGFLILVGMAWADWQCMKRRRRREEQEDAAWRELADRAEQEQIEQARRFTGPSKQGGV